MRRLLVLPLLTAANAPADPPPTGRDTVVVEWVSDNPGAGSGLIAFAVQFRGRNESGPRLYFIPFLHRTQPRPQVGETCVVAWRWFQGFQWRLADGRSFDRGREVTKFDCRRGER